MPFLSWSVNRQTSFSCHTTSLVFTCQNQFASPHIFSHLTHLPSTVSLQMQCYVFQAVPCCICAVAACSNLVHQAVLASPLGFRGQRFAASQQRHGSGGCIPGSLRNQGLSEPGTGSDGPHCSCLRQVGRRRLDPVGGSRSLPVDGPVLAQRGHEGPDQGVFIFRRHQAMKPLHGTVHHVRPRQLHLRVCRLVVDRVRAGALRIATGTVMAQRRAHRRRLRGHPGLHLMLQDQGGPCV